MSWIIITALIVSGLLVGFINTLAGGGTIISLSLLMFLGLPPTVANGTNRVAVFFQNLVAVRSFRKQKVLDTKKGILLGIPCVVGSIIGSQIAVKLNDQFIQISIGITMLIMLFFILFKPKYLSRNNEKLLQQPINKWQYLIFFIIGIYGGFIHVGVGYFMLASIILGVGYNVVKANAIKNLVVLMYAPFSLAVFMYSGMVNYRFGLIHALGNVIGAALATKFAVNWGITFVRWTMVVIILVCVLQMFGVIDFKNIFSAILS
jgi:uncharacterized protein